MGDFFSYSEKLRKLFYRIQWECFSKKVGGRLDCQELITTCLIQKTRTIFKKLFEKARLV